ncbi:MAG: NAD(P)H-binding protein [bacterium]
MRRRLPPRPTHRNPRRGHAPNARGRRSGEDPRLRRAPLPRPEKSLHDSPPRTAGPPGVLPIDIAITGANGSVGRSLIQRLGEGSLIVPTRLRALVRSLGRADALRPLPAELTEVDYRAPDSVREAIRGAEAIVHLAGALRPRAGESLLDSNAGTTEALVEAAREAGVKRFIYLSFPGADAGAKNPYLRSKGLAEKAIDAAGFEGAIFRVPMILGPENAAWTGLRRMASAPVTLLAGGGAVRVQPVSQDDVLAAVEWALATPLRPLRVINLVGPETLTFADLIRRVGVRLGRRPRILPIPRAAAWLSALLAARLLPSLGWNWAVFDTLCNEHLADPIPARTVLPFPLASVSETLDRALSNAA